MGTLVPLNTGVPPKTCMSECMTLDLIAEIYHTTNSLTSYLTWAVPILGTVPFYDLSISHCLSILAIGTIGALFGDVV